MDIIQKLNQILNVSCRLQSFKMYFYGYKKSLVKNDIIQQLKNRGGGERNYPLHIVYDG